jgi:hypothetical protein
MSRINLITVCTEKYSMLYARKLIQRFTELSDYIVDPYCITDRPNQIDDLATPIAAPFKTWWNKMYCYSNEMPAGWNVYLDIDNVLLKNFDEVIDFAINKNSKMACLADSIGWMNNKFCSSMMIYETGRMQDIYELFLPNEKKLIKFDGGDQVWTGKFLRDNDICYLNEELGDKWKKNLKFDLGKKVMGQWKFPEYIPNNIKIVDCGGRPKPHELENLRYIKENWHDIGAQ